MVDALIFDMDGLLLDTEPLWSISMLRVAQKHGIPITPDKFKETTGLKIHEVVDYWSVKYPWAGSSVAKVAQDILDDIIALAKEKGRLMPGALRLLKEIKTHGLKIGLATSSPTVMMKELIGHFDLMSYFDVLTSADEVGPGKPHPAVFLECAKKLETEPLRCVVLEDSLNGIIAGKAARIKVITIPDKAWYHDVRFSLADYKAESLEYINIEIITAL